jgi:hypothetical protein
MKSLRPALAKFVKPYLIIKRSKKGLGAWLEK